MDLEHAERDEEIKLGATSEPTVVWSWDRWDDRNLPVEGETPAPAGDPAVRLQNLRAFHLYGRRPADAAAPGAAGALPALLHRYRELARVRHEYPLCVDGNDPAVRTLTEWTDQFLAEQAPEGDAGEQLKRNLYRLESLVRSLAAEREGERLSVLWDRAAATALETSNVPEDKEALLREHIAAVRKGAAGDVEVVGCGPHAALRLLQISAGVYWRERCAEWTGELDTLVNRLQDILNADFSHSDAARSPGHLQESLGTDGEDVDVAAMSDLLARVPRESALAPARRARIEALLATLKQMQPVFDAHEGAPIRHDTVFEDSAAAIQEERSRSALMTVFFRAVRVARLEIQNRYRPDLHDAFFDGFDERYLSADERALCPPVLVHLSDDALAHAETGVLLGILNATAPIKVLVEMRTLYRTEGTAAFPSIRLVGGARLASMAVALNQAYVLQAPISQVGTLRAGLLDGLRYDGPALFCVYAPEASTDPAGAPYLRAAAAAESRFFPVLTFDPARGVTLAERIDVGNNPEPATVWPLSSFAFRNAAGDEATTELAFTPADFLFCDRRLAAHFWAIEPARWHDGLTPLHEYLKMTGEQAAGRIPYLLTVDREGHVGRVVVTRPVIDAAFQCRAFWRGVQESGGINNSFAKLALAAERERLAADKEREVEAIEKNYLAQLDQDVGELTREIVQRIASQLMGAEGMVYSASATPVAAPRAVQPAAAPAAEATSPAPAVAEPDEVAVSFDDPYIDTPLCTSCNECTQLNNRMFTYNGNKQAEIKDASAGPFSDLVRAAELCPVHIIHPGKPKNPNEPGLDDWVARAAKFN